MRLRREKERGSQPIGQAGYPLNFNPWLLALMPSWAHPNLHRVGFVTNQLRHASRHFDLERHVGELFLANTRSHSHRSEWSASLEEYFGSFVGPVASLSGSESVNSRSILPLPPPAPLALSLGSALSKRRSTRRFSGDAIELVDLATMLYAANGVVRLTRSMPSDGGEPYESWTRAVPSAGGLYPIDCYALGLRVQSLPRGAYKYLSREHALAYVGPLDAAEKFLRALTATDFIGLNPETMATALVVVGNPQKTARKYGARGVRYLLLEAGMISMVANLAAIALGHGTLDYQSFVDEQVHDALEVEGNSRHVLHLLLVGSPLSEDPPIPEESLDGTNRNTARGSGA